MANISKSGTPSLSSVVPPQNCVIGSGLKAGEAIAAGDLVYIKSDGKFWRTNGTSANAAAKVDGIAVKAAPVGEPVDVYRNVEVRYGASMTPGTRVYASATAGAIADAATTGGTAPIGLVVDATRVYIHGSAY
jgi:hypothetical protein